MLGRLHGARVRASPAVAVEIDASVVVRSDEAGGVGRAHAPVVEAVREHDDVACEPVAAHVRRLPHVVGVRRQAERVVERASVQRAAPIALPVGADDEEWPVDGVKRRAAGQERAGEIDAAEVVLVLDLEPEEPLLSRVRTSRSTRSGQPASGAPAS